MSSSTLIEVFGHIVFSFTRGVTEHYNPEEPEFTAESFGYNPLESTGREWNYLPVDELIYQEYSGREVATLDFLAASRLEVRVINACSPEEEEEIQENQQDEDKAMAWKRLRPSALRTVCQSMYIGALISLLTATIIGSLYMLISYVCYQTIQNCEFHQKESIPVKIQWIRTLSGVIACVFLYMWFFCGYAFPFSNISVNRSENKTDSRCVSFILSGYTLSCAPSSLWNISLQAFCITEDSTQRFVCYQCMLASLSSNKSLPGTIKEGEFIFKNDNTKLFHFRPWYLHSVFYLPDVQQTK